MKIPFLTWCCGAVAAWLGLALPVSGAEGRLASSLFVRVSQSSDAAATNNAARAVDGLTGTFSLTADAPGGYWSAALPRPYPLTQVQIVNRTGADAAELGGLTLRLYNMDDQVVFQAGVTNPGSGGTFTLNLPPGTMGRTVWIGLPGADVNGAGNRRVGFAEVRLTGVLNLPFGPDMITTPTNSFQVWQSSEYPGFPAGNAVNGSLNDFTHTADLADGYWMTDLGRAATLSRLEFVNRNSCCAERFSGLVVRIFNAASNSVWSTNIGNVALGGTFVATPPAGTIGRWIRVGLENGQRNGGNNYYVTLAEARVFSGTTNLLAPAGAASIPVTNNLASFKPAYMLRLQASIPSATNANDNNLATETSTTTATVDGYWETDLGATYALYGVRSIAASGISYRLTNTIVRLYNDAHESVYSKKVSGLPEVFDTDLEGPVFARYVRVGLEDKQRTDPAGGIEFYIGFKEVEVFGLPTNNIGINSFTVSTNRVAAGGQVTLSWQVTDVRRVEVHPNIGSVGAHTAPSGAGSLTVTVTNSTEFVLVASNAAGVFSRGVSVLVAPEPLPVRLSEFVAENRFSLKDGYDDASDWIELRNTGDTGVNLAGYGLSDNPAQPHKWVFPAVTLAPHATLIVFASGRNTPVDPAGRLHAGFSLNKDGGSVVLSSPASNIIDSIIAYPAQDTDLAYGRDLAGNWTFIEPTPNAVNYAVTYAGWLKPLDFSHPRGFHETPFTLTLTNNSPGSTILFSTNGSAPSVPYTGGLAIGVTRSVRAQAVRPGYRPARVQTRTYIFINSVITSPVMNTAITQNPSFAPRLRPALLSLPTISLNLPGQPEYAEAEGSVEVLWPDGREGVQANCGISRFGNAWTKFEKRSFRIKCRSEYGETRLRVPLLNGFDRGVLAQTSFDELDLRSGSQDMVERGFYMAGRFVEDSMLDMGGLNPHGRFVHVYVNGVYWGQYDAREPMVEDFMASYLGGTKDDYVTVRGNDNVGDNFSLGAPEPPKILPWERILSLRNSYLAVKPYVDVPHMLDFLLLWNYGNCESEYRACGSVDAGSGIKFWIADADGFLRTSASGLNRTSRNGPGDLFSSLRAEAHPDFRTLLADRIYKHFFNGGALTPAAMDARLAARMLEINDSLIVECARWNYRTPATWLSDAAAIRSGLFPTRTSELFGMLRSAGLYPTFDPPSFSQFGGPVPEGYQPQLSAPAGVIYYTLDGTDPRLPGGGVSPTAMVWVPGAVTITGEVTFNARVLNNGQWSALSQPRYVQSSRRPPASRDLLVSEIHYNPAGSDDYEFIELHNASASPLNLSGVSLTNAVRYVFPSGFSLAPGRFVVIAKDPSLFAGRYQTPGAPAYFADLNVVGPWSGSLDNAGEEVSLVASNGVTLASIRYGNGGAWPGRADGRGSSLELRALPPSTASDADVREYVADPASWSSSSLYQGSPGRFDSFIRSLGIHELVSHSLLGEDWIELHNAGAEAVSLADCTLTDDLNQPSRFAFAPDAVILPGQYLVLTAGELGFAFGELGEGASFLLMSGTNIIRFLDTVDFPAVAPEEPFGVVTRLDGERDFTELLVATPGAANAAPRVGPLVLSEIHFAPAPGMAQFVEFTSLTNGVLNLFDPANPTNTWMLEGVGSFAFPEGATLGAQGTLIVCSTNPAAFREQYGLSEAVPVYGPWSGVLDSNGETLRLLRPGEPRTNGLPRYRVDHVTYSSRSPWPPVAPGWSLQKGALAGYGNDSAHWTAATPSPGTSLPPGDRPTVLVPPQNLSIFEGQNAIFTVVADGTAPLSYQWRYRGTPLTGATNTTLLLTNVLVAAAGPYDVVVFSPSGSTVSPAATLVVIKPPTITTHPVNSGARPGSNVVFSVTATGNGPLRYQWRFNGTALPGQTNSLLLINNAGFANAGSYTVVVTDDLGSSLSQPAMLTILIDPVIVIQPLSQSIPTGGTVTLSVTVTNTATLPVNFRWRRGSVTFTNFLLNTRTCFLTLSNVVAPFTNWSVVVTNLARHTSGLVSSNAFLTLLADANANGFPDNWEAAYGFGPGNPLVRNADNDGDGASNWEEYVAGTDPRTAASVFRVVLPSAGGGVQLSFGAVSNRTYSVFYTDDLNGAAWTRLADFAARRSNRVEVIVDPGWTTNRFYRATVPRQP